MATRKGSVSVTQRKYLFNKILENVVKSLREKNKKQLALVNEFNLAFGASYYRKDVAFTVEKTRYESDWYDLRIHEIQRSDLLNEKVCTSKTSVAKLIEKATGVSTEWKHKEFDAGNYKTEIEFEPCMSNPKVGVVFTNEEKERKRLISSRKRKFTSLRKKAMVAMSELEYARMEANKLLDKAADEVMLMGSDDAKDIINEFNKLIKGL